MMGMLENLWPEQPAVCLERSSETRLILEVFYDCVREFPGGMAGNLPMSGQLGEDVPVDKHSESIWSSAVQHC